MTADVREMPWSMLHPRTDQPQSVMLSVAPEDMHGFLRTLATNPLQDTGDSTVLKKVVSGYRTSYSEGVLASEAVVNGKRKRAGSPDEDSEEDNLRRTRRSTRPKTRQDISEDQSWEAAGKSRGNEPKIGPQYQVHVSKFCELNDTELSGLYKVESSKVFSPDELDGVDNFMKELNSTLKRRDGYGCGPNAEEIALVKLSEHKGNIEQALEAACKTIRSVPVFEGAGEQWGYDEKCRFVRALAERGQDFEYISRNAINRKTSEIVFMYHAYHRQQVMIHGNSAQGLIFDTGEELTEFLPRLAPERVYAALRCLAQTAGDGFPADRRMANAVRSVRSGAVLGSKRARTARGRLL